MIPTLFFSDVHLKAAAFDRSRHQDFIRFLKEFAPPRCQRYVCIGDLFDFWFEYRHAIFSGYFEVLRTFAELRDAGVELHLVCGNHDFWSGEFLRELGFIIHAEPTTIEICGKRVHLCHGDGIDPGDHGYHIYKRIARNRLVVGLFRMLHPDLAMKLAQGVSHGSRTYLGEKDPATGRQSRVLRAYGQRVLDSGEADVVFCGHAHAATHEQFETPTGMGDYFNTGEWISGRSYVLWDGEHFELVRGWQG